MISKTADIALFFIYAVFLFGSTFSIAIAQISLGVALVLYLIIAAAGGCSIFAGLRLKRYYLLVGCFVVWLAASAAVHDGFAGAVRVITEEWLFLIVPVGIYLNRRREYGRHLATVFASGTLVVAIYGILQHFTGVSWFKTDPLLPAPDFGYLVCGRFPHPLTFGNYFATASVFLLGLSLASKISFHRSYRMLFAFASVMAAAAAVLSYSRGSILGLVIGVVVLGLLKERKYVLFIAGIVAVAAVVMVAADPDSPNRIVKNLEREYNLEDPMGRLFIWSTTLDMVEDHPILGVGQGNYKPVYGETMPQSTRRKQAHAHAHNDVLNFAAVSGVPGMLLYLVVWIYSVRLFWMGWRANKQPAMYRTFSLAALAGSVAFFGTSLTEATFADDEVRQMLMALWAFGLTGWYNREEMPVGRS